MENCKSQKKKPILGNPGRGGGPNSSCQKIVFTYLGRLLHTWKIHFAKSNKKRAKASLCFHLLVACTPNTVFFKESHNPWPRQTGLTYVLGNIWGCNQIALTIDVALPLHKQAFGRGVASMVRKRARREKRTAPNANDCGNPLSEREPIQK